MNLMKDNGGRNEICARPFMGEEIGWWMKNRRRVKRIGGLSVIMELLGE